MAQYAKIKTSITFDKLIADKEKYEMYNAYSYRTPQIFYLWIIRKNEIIFFRRPNHEIKRDTPVLKYSVIFEDRQKAKKIARNMTPQILHRIFKNTKTIFL